MKLTQLIDAWEILRVKDTGEIRFCDLDNALTAVGVRIFNHPWCDTRPDDHNPSECGGNGIDCALCDELKDRDR